MNAYVTLLRAAVVWRASPTSRCHASGRLAQWVTAIDALLRAEANAGARAGADVWRRVGQPREVLCLGGCHREAHRCHGNSFGGKNRREWEGC